MYIAKPIVIVLYDHYSRIKPLPLSLLGMYKGVYQRLDDAFHA